MIIFFAPSGILREPNWKPTACFFNFCVLLQVLRFLQFLLKPGEEQRGYVPYEVIPWMNLYIMVRIYS